MLEQYKQDKLVELKLKGHSCDDCFQKRQYRNDGVNKTTCFYKIMDNKSFRCKLPGDNICSHWNKGELIHVYLKR